MKKRAFDDLSSLFSVKYNDRLTVIFNEPPLIKMRQHPEDEGVRIPFLTYLGGETKEELKKIAEKYQLDDFQIRQSKRTQYPFELKIKGIKFSKLQQLIKELD